MDPHPHPDPHLDPNRNITDPEHYGEQYKKRIPLHVDAQIIVCNAQQKNLPNYRIFMREQI
jgi:hypothetical protein